MTELEKIERAKMYMDKLANGIDPLSDTEAPESDIINNVRLSRCFFFVSDVLRQVIDKGGITPQKKDKKVPFSISAGELLRYDFSETPIPVSEISKRVTSLSNNPNMQQMKHTAITNWLIEMGFLSTEPSSTGQRTKRPTKAGREIGIGTEERTGVQGPYQVVVYDLAAQHFIMDNFEDILRAENASGELQGQPWSKEHDECLVDLYKKDVSISEIAVTLKRSTSSVRSRLKKLGFQL